MLKLKVIACDVLNREIAYLSSQSECYVDVTFLHQGLHNTPDKLREEIQSEIDKVNEGFPYNYFNTSPDYDYIILAYGLCSNGIVGITSQNIPLVIPRGHDCITLLLGSKERYKSYFDLHPGTYWFSSGWIERGWQPSELKYAATYKDYVDKYGEDNALYLMEMEQTWMKEYKSAAYINWSCVGNSEYYKQFTKESSNFFKWDYSELEGDSSLLNKLLNGIFNENEVLVLPPKSKVAPSFGDDIVKAE